MILQLFCNTISMKLSRLSEIRELETLMRYLKSRVLLSHYLPFDSL